MRVYMQSQEINFLFDYELLNKDKLDIIFNRIANLLDIRFNEDLNPYYEKNNENIYDFEDVSDTGSGLIKNKINSFFNFTFDDIVDVCLYKFLVLKNNDKLTVLARIHSLIFDYTSINEFYDIFNNFQHKKYENNIFSYYDELNNILNSSDFDNDCEYWINNLSDIEDHIGFYKIRSNNYLSKKLSFNHDALNEFLNTHKISKFNFFTAVFSLYPFLVDGSKISLLKTFIPSNKKTIGPNDKSTFLKIDYVENETFKDYLNRVKNIYDDAYNHTRVDVENYVDIKSYYSIHDLTNIKGVNVRNGDVSALTFNIYEDSVELIYNYGVFSKSYIKYLLKNIEFVIDSILKDFNQQCSNLEELYVGNKYDFDGQCPMSNSQIIIYLDEMRGKKTTIHNNPIKLTLEDKYSVDDIKNSLKKLFDLHPTFYSRIVEDEYVFDFNAKPPIVVGSMDDIESFVQLFDLHKYLARFLIIPNEDNVVLCMDYHSLIFDNTSLSTIIADLFKILNGQYYNDVVDNGSLRQISFEESIEGYGYTKKAQKFFDKLLADKDEVYDLVFSVEDYSSKYYFEDFDIDSDSFNLFLKSQNITHNQFFTSVFAYTLSRFTGSSKVLFNLITDGRNHLGLSHSVGVFFRVSPVLMDCKNQSVDSYINYSRKLIDSVMKYDLYSLLELTFNYGLNNDVFFYYLPYISKEAKNVGIERFDKEIPSNFSVSVYYLKENKFRIRILYSEEYSDNFIKHFINSFKMILHDMLNVSQLSDINYVKDSDLRILDSYNKTEYKLNYEDILDAFNYNLSKNPNNKLVSYKNTSYTYAEGAFIANKIYNSLKSLGVKKQENIAFLVERSELYVFAILGILARGDIYIPLDTSHPDERIKFILNDAKPKVLIVSDNTFKRAKSLADDLIILNISDIMKGDIESLNSLPIVYGDLASILYTSGTTGNAKGVKVTRKAIINSTQYYADTYGMTNKDVYGLFSTIGFNSASLAICQCIYSGACLSIVPDEIKSDIHELNDYFIEQGVTHTMITTQISKLFVENIKETSLKVLLAGGEKLGQFESPQDYKLIDALGLTEAFALISSIYNAEKIDYTSIGRLNYNTKAYVLDDEGRRVPIGAVGELCLSGYQISQGYLNREEENSQAFVDNPFDDDENYNVLCHTGDMVRVLPDGTFGFEGRRDSQVKIRGLRLDLSEVEAVIREIDYVEDVTVQSVKYDDNNELVAYVVLNNYDGDNFKEDILQYVAEHKPDYMVPLFMIQLDYIPLNINGKVDKRALPKVKYLTVAKDYVAPTTKIEKYVVHAFEVAFNQKHISLFDDFVALRGDSLTAFEIVTILSNYDIEIDVDVIFNKKTPYNIAKFIKKNNKS